MEDITYVGLDVHKATVCSTDNNGRRRYQVTWHCWPADTRRHYDFRCDRFLKSRQDIVSAEQSAVSMLDLRSAAS